jgi:hypothetical protein
LFEVENDLVVVKKLKATEVGEDFIYYMVNGVVGLRETHDITIV